jgi:alpha-beta hydrolase superfamily lysophospholipase
MATTTEGFITSSDGTRLFFRRHAAAAPKARILVIHGFAEHGGRYLELLEALADAGFDALAFDLRGHGRSDGLRADLRRFEDYLDDTHAAFEAGIAPPVRLEATHEKAMQIVQLAALRYHAIEDDATD